MTFDGEYILRFNKFLQPTAIEKGQHEFVLASDFDALEKERRIQDIRIQTHETCMAQVEADNKRLISELIREKNKVEKLLGAVVQVNHGDGYYSHHKAIFQYDHPGQSRVVIHAGEQFEAESEVRCE